MSRGCTCLKDYRVVCPYHPLDHQKIEVLGQALRNFRSENQRLKAMLKEINDEAVYRYNTRAQLSAHWIIGVTAKALQEGEG